MIDKARIEEEAAKFFEWPDPKRHDHVTLVSCRIFAATIAQMAVAVEREHTQTLRTALQEADTLMGHEDDHTAWRERWQHLWPWGGPSDKGKRTPEARSAGGGPLDPPVGRLPPEARRSDAMKVDEMKTPTDALRWALRRIETAGLGCGDHFQRAEELLEAAPGLPVEVYCYWPDGHRQHMEFARWPQRQQLPADAVRFDIAWPDPSVVARLKPPNV